MSRVVVDTGVLVRAFLDETADGDALRALLARRAVRGARFAVPVYCVSEFWAIATDLRTPGRLTPRQALTWLDGLLTRGAVLLVPGPTHWRWLNRVLVATLPIGLSISNCQIAALCNEHGIREIWTFDRAFSALDGIDAVDPLGFQREGRA